MTVTIVCESATKDVNKNCPHLKNINPLQKKKKQQQKKSFKVFSILFFFNQYIWFVYYDLFCWSQSMYNEFGCFQLWCYWCRVHYSSNMDVEAWAVCVRWNHSDKSKNTKRGTETVDQIFSIPSIDKKKLWMNQNGSTIQVNSMHHYIGCRTQFNQKFRRYTGMYQLHFYNFFLSYLFIHHFFHFIVQFCLFVILILTGRVLLRPL